MSIIIKVEKGKSLVEVLNEKMATIGEYLGQNLTEVLDYSSVGMDILAAKTQYYILHTNNLFNGNKCNCDYYFTTNANYGIYQFGLTYANLI